jgi:hypothetical protein
VISRLRRALLTAIGRGPGPTQRAAANGRLAADAEASRRIEAARRRLKAAIPPPPD